MKNELGDQKAIYRDGALGGYAPFVNRDNMSAAKRREGGFAQAMADGKALIESLDEGETIKLVSHSMGGAYAKGYALGLQAYMKANGIENVKIEIEVDFAPYQPDNHSNAAILCNANSNISSFA